MASITHDVLLNKPRNLTSFLEALPVKLDIKRHSPSIHYIFSADVVLETLPHAISGKAPILPRALENPPRETSIIKYMTPRKDLLIFPQAKSTDFKLSLPPQSGRAKTLSSTTGLFINRAEQNHPPPTLKKPESFYNTNIATAPSPIPEERNTTLFRNRQSVQVNPSNSPGDNSVSKQLKRQSSITSLGDNDYSAFAKLPAALEPEPSRQYCDTSTRFSGSSGKESDPGKVNVPLTARPIVISPETCISVNMKSQIEEQSVNSNNDTSQSINLDQSESQNKVFMSLPLTEANVAKQSDDIMVINTPEGTFDSALRSPLTDMMTNDDVSLPVSRQDSISNIINATENSLVSSSPIPAVTDGQELIKNGSPIQTIVSPIQKNQQLKLDIDLI